MLTLERAREAILNAYAEYCAIKPTKRQAWLYSERKLVELYIASLEKSGRETLELRSRIFANPIRKNVSDMVVAFHTGDEPRFERALKYTFRYATGRNYATQHVGAIARFAIAAISK